MTDSVSLYHACLQDGSDAQIDAFKQLWNDLYRVSYRMTHHRADGAALAADCTQAALVKIYRNLAQCRDPSRFRGWAAQIARRVVIDTLRQPGYMRQVPLSDEDPGLMVVPMDVHGDLHALLLGAIQQGALSDRSRRVVIGRFFDERSDEELAREESRLSGEQVLPSHIQVTRAKNLAKLRRNTALIERLREYLAS